MKAVVGETVVAEAASEAVISIEGNAYFPPDSVAVGALRNSPTPYICPWKGRAQYHDVVVSETVLRDGAWSYPNIKESAATRVGRDFSGYVAFDAGKVRIEKFDLHHPAIAAIDIGEGAGPGTDPSPPGDGWGALLAVGRSS